MRIADPTKYLYVGNPPNKRKQIRCKSSFCPFERSQSSIYKSNKKSRSRPQKRSRSTVKKHVEHEELKILKPIYSEKPKLMVSINLNQQNHTLDKINIFEDHRVTKVQVNIKKLLQQNSDKFSSKLHSEIIPFGLAKLNKFRAKPEF